MARIAPGWMAMLNSAHSSALKPSSSVARIRWPVDETGRYSVTPSTMPRMMTSSRTGMSSWGFQASVARGGRSARRGGSGRAIRCATAPSGVGSIPNAFKPVRSWARRHCRVWSMIHWSRVSGAPGRKPKRDMQVGGEIGHVDQLGRLARRLGDRGVQLAHGHHLRPGDLVGLAAMRCGIERGGGDRLRQVADIDRLEAGVGRDHRQQRKARHPGEAVGELVLGPEHQARADDRRGRESGADRGLALALGAAIGRLAVRVGADRRDVDEGGRAGVARGLGGRLGARDMDGVEIALEDRRPG